MTQELYWYWEPQVELTPVEEMILKKACKNRKLFEFLRKHRHLIFNREFQEELCEMYRMTGAGLPPVPPALMAMATLLQKYAGVSDNEVEALLFADKRWQMVLDSLDQADTPFKQTTFFDFRIRLIETGTDKRILERTAQVARETGGFSIRGLRLALDSGPLEGHGKVEDTVNLLGHAAKKAIQCLAKSIGLSVSELAEQMDCQLFDGSSIKAALDANWSNPQEKKEALHQLYYEVEHLELWLKENYPEACERGTLQETLKTIDVVLQQNLEWDSEGDGVVKFSKGVAPERQISVEDKEIRHGRKSSSKRIDGLKNHVARDLDGGIILAAISTAANRPDSEPAEELIEDACETGRDLESLHVDRQYLHSEKVIELEKSGVGLFCRSLTSSNRKGLFRKSEFELDLEEMTAKCPNGQLVEIELGKTVEFEAQECDKCPLREKCTSREKGGRTLHIHENEKLFQRLQTAENTSEGRKELRERVDVEHGLSHIVRRQGKKARYNGIRKNTFDLRMICAIQNLERAQAFEAEKLQKAA